VTGPESAGPRRSLAHEGSPSDRQASGSVVRHGPGEGDTAGACAPRSIAVYRRGPRWVDGRSLREQPALLEHGRFLADLERRGVAVHAGPVHQLDDVTWSELIGVASFAVDTEAARLLMRDDPAVRSGLLHCEVTAWYVAHE